MSENPGRARLAIIAAMLCVFLFGIVFGNQFAQRKTRPSRSALGSPRNQSILYHELNKLKAEVNLTFGVSAGHPRIDMGPCGSFAREFQESWNSRFKGSDSAKIAFIKILGNRYCRHVLIQLPNGLFFDGGRGVMKREEVEQLYREVNGEIDPAMFIEVMEVFDEELLKQNSVAGPYPDCPNYTPERARELIDAHLDKLVSRLDAPE